MKRLLILVLSLVLCIVVLVGCGEKNDNRPAEERITVGMSCSEVRAIMGSNGIKSDMAPNILIWDTGEEQDLYVFFDLAVNYSHLDPSVVRVERREDLKLTIGMTLNEIDRLLARGGVRSHNIANIYTWDYVSEVALYAWFDDEYKLVKYAYTDLPEIKTGMTYEEVVEFLGTEGRAVNNVYGLYKWNTRQKDNYLYVRFDGGEVTETFQGPEKSINPGMTYERIAELYNTQGTKISKHFPIYSWQTGEDTYGIFSFDNVNGTLKLLSFDVVSNGVAPGATLDEVDLLLGTYGTQLPYTKNICYWQLGASDRYLYARFVGDTVTEIFGVGMISIENGMRYERLVEIYAAGGVPLSNMQNVYSWEISDDSIGIFKFDVSKGTRTLACFDTVPKNATIGSSLDDFYTLLGSDGEAVSDIPGLYRWPVDSGSGYLYVRFVNDVAAEFLDIGNIGLEPGVSYARIAQMYGMEGVLVSRWKKIYTWPTADGKNGIFKFKETSDGLVLEQFDLEVGSVSVGMTLDEAYGSLGVSGINTGVTTTVVYRWRTDIKESLYVWFDESMTVTKFSYESDIAIKKGLTADDMEYILGPPTYRRNLSDRWTTSTDMDIYVSYNNYTFKVDAIHYVPQLNIYNGMTLEYTTWLMGNEPETVVISDLTWYVWRVGESGYELYVLFSEDYGAYDMYFKQMTAEQ